VTPIRALDPAAVDARSAELARLLIDAVEDGASIGFLAPLPEIEALAYWRSVVDAIGAGRRHLLAAFEGNRLIGTVQLDLEPRANGRHRAEVMKLMVLRSDRRRGVARRLMAALLEVAGAQQRSLLLLDVRAGDPVEALYQNLGFRKFGEVPRHAQSPDGRFAASSFYYLEL
jgi:ribosomal protein S18 acetylase RimI-like enzyme